MWWKKRPREERELDEELRFHLEQEAQLRRERGQDPHTARRDFGNLTAVRESTREQWGWIWAERAAQDARFAVRLLRKSPAFALTAIAVLAFGIGATTAIFSVVHAVLLRPLPYPESDRLVMVWERQPFGRTNVIQTQNFLDWRARNHSFTRISAMHAFPMNLVGDTDPVQVPGMRISAGFFEILGVPPLLGRGIAASDDVPGAAQVLVLSYSLWQQRFGGRSDIIGTKVSLEGGRAEVIGVMPPGFAYPTARADFWIPMRLNPADASRDGRNYQSVARLKPGVTLAQAQSDMEAVAAECERERPQMNRKWSALVVPLIEQTVGASRDTLQVLLGAGLFVLLIACANVANLLLMRAAGRQREMTVRIALGAGRWRLLHQTAIESLLLALAGGAVGFLLAWWGVPLLVRALPLSYPLPRRGEIAVDAPVLWFTTAVSMACGLIFGLFPALQADRARVAEGLKQGGRTGSGTGRKLRNALAAAEIAVAMVLVTGAGLMLRSFAQLNQQALGFQPDHVLTMPMTLLFSKYLTNLPRRANIVTDILERVRSLPQVESASSISSLPTRPSAGTGYDRGDRPPAPPGSGKGGDVSVVSDDYFRTMRIPLLAGREFDRQDRMGSKSVVILNRSAARMLFDGESPMGKRLRVEWGGATNPEVIGVVEDMRHYGYAVPPQPILYVCNTQAPGLFASLVVRTRGEPSAAIAAIKEQLRKADPEQGGGEIRPLGDLVNAAIAGPRVQTFLLGGFGALALMLACVGIYAVIAYSVAQRNREMGIRLVLGAAPAVIRAMVLREGMAVAAGGIAGGLLAALALTRYMRTLLFAVEPTDLGVYAAVCGVLILSAAAGCWLPARRATAVDPAAVLREE
jgi:putative ABC transport system permease protein